jgi:hypothetical protein
MSDSSSRSGAASREFGDDWRARWLLPILAVSLGLLVNPAGLARGEAVGMLIALLGGLSALAGGIGLADRAAAALIEDAAQRDRLRFHARTANLALLILFAISVGIFEGTRLIAHLGPTQSVQGVVRHAYVRTGRKGSRTVQLTLNDASYEWRCYWVCSGLDDLTRTQGRTVTLDALGDREILGARVGQTVIVDTDRTRGGLLALDGLVVALCLAGVGAIGTQTVRRVIAGPQLTPGTVQ